MFSLKGQGSRTSISAKVQLQIFFFFFSVCALRDMRITLRLLLLGDLHCGPIVFGLKILEMSPNLYKSMFQTVIFLLYFAMCLLHSTASQINFKIANK